MVWLTDSSVLFFPNPPPSKTVTSISQVSRSTVTLGGVALFISLEGQPFIDPQGHVILL